VKTQTFKAGDRVTMRDGHMVGTVVKASDRIKNAVVGAQVVQWVTVDWDNGYPYKRHASQSLRRVEC
jgi:hypothetical protein